MSGFSIVEVIRIGSNYSVIVPLVLYLYKLRNAPKQNHIIGFLLIAAAIFDMIGIQLYRQKLPTQTLFNSYSLIEFILVAFFFYEIVFKKKATSIFYTGIGTFIASFILITLFVQGFKEDQTWVWAIEGMVIIVFSFYYLYHLRYSAHIFDPTLSSSFSFTAGLIMYFCSTVWLFILYRYFIDKDDLEVGKFVWSFHNFLNITKNLIFAWGMYVTGKKIVDH